VSLLNEGAEAGLLDVLAGTAAAAVEVVVVALDAAVVVGAEGVVAVVGNGELTVGSVSGKVTVGSVSGDVTVVISGRGVVSATAVATEKPQAASTTRAPTVLTS
jgi:hypothetical protein